MYHRAPNRNPSLQILASIGFVLCILLTQISIDNKDCHLHLSLPLLDLRFRDKGESSRSRSRRFPLAKRIHKPRWNDGLSNSVKKQRQHKRRGLYLRVPGSIWSLRVGVGMALCKPDYKGRVGNECLSRLGPNLPGNRLRIEEMEAVLSPHGNRRLGRERGLKFQFECLRAKTRNKGICSEGYEPFDQVNQEEKIEPLPTMVEETQSSSAPKHKDVACPSWTNKESCLGLAIVVMAAYPVFWVKENTPKL